MNKKGYLILLVSLIFFCSYRCGIATKKNGRPKRAPSGFEFINENIKGQYDSVLAYQDVNFVNYRGVGSPFSSTSSLPYPFAVLCYRGKNIDIYIFIDEGKSIKHCVKSVYKTYDFSHCSYFDIDSKDTLITCGYLLNDTTKIDFDIRKQNFDSSLFKFSSFRIWNYKEGENLKSTYFSLFTLNETFYLPDLIANLNNGEVIHYAGFQENEYEISNNTFIQLREKKISKEYPEENRNDNERVVHRKNLSHSSFFFYYADVLSFCNCVNSE